MLNAIQENRPIHDWSIYEFCHYQTSNQTNDWKNERTSNSKHSSERWSIFPLVFLFSLHKPSEILSVIYVYAHTCFIDLLAQFFFHELIIQVAVVCCLFSFLRVFFSFRKAVGFDRFFHYLEYLFLFRFFSALSYDACLSTND